MQADSADPSAIADAVDQAAKELGGLDILVNNAGIARDGAASTTFKLEDLDRMLA